MLVLSWICASLLSFFQIFCNLSRTSEPYAQAPFNNPRGSQVGLPLSLRNACKTSSATLSHRYGVGFTPNAKILPVLLLKLPLIDSLNFLGNGYQRKISFGPRLVAIFYLADQLFFGSHIQPLFSLNLTPIIVRSLAQGKSGTFSLRDHRSADCELNHTEAIGSVEEFDCVSFKIEADGAIRAVVDDESR